MAMTAADVMKMLKEKEVKFVDLRFTDTRGKEQHVSVPIKAFTMEKFEVGHFFDGSSIAGWKGIEASDMLLMPDPDSARMDPFTDEPVLGRERVRPRSPHDCQARRGLHEVDRLG
jgi:glutamine synthetase